METNNHNNNNGIIYYTLTFVIALLFELYWIFTNPYDYFMIVGIGIIVVITCYLTIDGIVKAKNAERIAREQHNEMMIKAQKAIYLATKKSVVEAEKSREQNMKALEVLMSSMVSSQKELVNVITTKSDELAVKQLDVHDNSADVEALVDKLTKSNDKLAKQVQDAMTINELVKTNAELVKSVKESLELNTISVDNISEIVNKDPILEEAEKMDLPEEDVPEMDIPEMNIPDIPSMDVPNMDMPEMDIPDMPDFGIDELPVEDTIDATVDETIEDTITATIEDTPVEDTSAYEIDNEINMAKLEEAQTLEDMTVAEEISPELDEEMSSTEAPNGTDPNKPLSEEEIAALFASL